MDDDDQSFIHNNCYPVVRGPDDGVISVDVSRDALVDSMTDMSETPIPPDIIASVDTPGEHEENEKLTLAYERLYDIPKTIVERFSDHIKYLDISHNKITNLDALVYFKSLTSLIADDNPITENCYLPPLPKLELLWLNRCQITSLYPWVGKLKESCPNLQILSLMGNPAAPSYFNGGTFYEYLQYRLFVISQFPSLHHLDDRRVTEDQRLEAQRLYKRPFFERIVKPAGLSQIVNSSVTWNTFQNKITTLLGKDKQNRNLLI
ncbi:leucine-rich melanocyte differentiation-associated protein isoform X1 [Helicoverpa armigera]|uniref:leucine-rich melanocyte differentiation-associated protein isoform X1 n=1 Tax=Helicoverpa armigera TaxID=29058 RepID=UPI0021134702|nr:leucine-rich melanocyte differentiation-associated protein isoform X2 [Helicoverpa armigera]